MGMDPCINDAQHYNILLVIIISFEKTSNLFTSTKYRPTAKMTIIKTNDHVHT